jgi:hypothetical protein
MLRINRVFLTLVFVLMVIPAVSLLAWKGVGGLIPLIERVAPAEAIAGETVSVTGFQLDSKHVSELYLSGPEIRYKVEILTQSESEIRFRVPANVPPGDLCIAMKVEGRTELVEQPVFLKIAKPVS